MQQLEIPFFIMAFFLEEVSNFSSWVLTLKQSQTFDCRVHITESDLHLVESANN